LTVQSLPYTNCGLSIKVYDLYGIDFVVLTSIYELVICDLDFVELLGECPEGCSGLKHGFIPMAQKVSCVPEN
jgi:hypothetical protein